MDDHDKINALWLNLCIILNQLEGLGEDVQTATDSPRVFGASGCVVWDHGTKSWVLETP